MHYGSRLYSKTVRYCPHCRSTYTTDVEHCGIDGTKLIESDDDPLLGDVVERYKILEVLAKGAMGSVYKVQHTTLENVYAMKVLFGDLSASRNLVERFRREAKAVSKIKHPNVVQVVDFGTTKNRLTFLLMEYVEGKTLATSLKVEGRYTPVAVAHIAREICAGLAEAHRLGFVHRDIKPANIMLTRKEGFDRVKILDFGIVGVAVAETSGDRLTESGYMVGTPLYMAPEQAMEAGNVGAAADLYSLGVIMYEMITGEPPFRGKTSLEVVIKHATEEIPKLPACGGLEFLARWLLEKSPDKRPKSAAEVIAEIDRLSFSRETNEKAAPVDGYSTTVEMTAEQAWGDKRFSG